MRPHFDIQSGKIFFKARRRVGGWRRYPARVSQPSGASRPKRRHRDGFPQARAVFSDAGLAHRHRGLVAIAAAAVDERHARANPGIVVDHDIVGHAERAHRVDDPRIEVEKVLNFDPIDAQATQHRGQFGEIRRDFIAKIRRINRLGR